MTRGADIIAAIILLALAIAIIVYLLHWLYRRSSKEVSFVRTGMLGEKVVISGGAFVLPIIHNITQVGMRTLSITIKRGGDKSLITKDRMRAELVTEFFTKVPPDPRAVSTAAQTLGNRTLDPEHLREVVQGRFADALGEVAAKMTLDEIQENRGQFVKEVTKIADGSIGHTGLALETVSIISLDQTPIEQFNPANTFDSQGLTQLTEQIETRKKKRNDITQDTKISIENKNLETVQKELEIKKNEEFIVYQGSHGDRGAEIADLIFPSAAFTEQNGLYENLEGRVQECKKASYPIGDVEQVGWLIFERYGNWGDHSYTIGHVEQVD